MCDILSSGEFIKFAFEHRDNFDAESFAAFVELISSAKKHRKYNTKKFSMPKALRCIRRLFNEYNSTRLIPIARAYVDVNHHTKPVF